MKNLILFLIACLCPIATFADNFNDYFIDSTLRIDYIFAGNRNSHSIYLDQLNQLPKWYGRRSNLDSLALEGNGQIIVRQHATQKVIYMQSFSSLFQEWLSYDEALKEQRAFENVFLVPFPKDTIDITICLKNNRKETTAELTHTVCPNDILIHKKGYSAVTPYEVIQEPNDSEHCINIAYLAEGFTENEMGHFMDKVNEANETLFAHEPFKGNRDCFRIVAVKACSSESGTSTPSKNDWKNTVLASHFDTFYSSRYLTTLNIKDMHDLLAGTPYEHIIVLVNTKEYGGGGIFNSYNLSMTDNEKFRPVVVHEFGHSFAGLADEYAYEEEDIPMYPLDIEPWEQNITTMVDFDSKWKDMIEKNRERDHNNQSDKVGMFEGAGYSLKGIFRPDFNCRMRTNEYPSFCPVCKRAIRRIINFYTGNKSFE